mmetsp:Transcript_887/g.3695  ORF Transcript_887/g.3695 Transcript_887/m.3695 type:complete len:296 (+) Transcript_887:685-1572(+)
MFMLQCTRLFASARLIRGSMKLLSIVSMLDMLWSASMASHASFPEPSLRELNKLKAAPYSGGSAFGSPARARSTSAETAGQPPVVYLVGGSFRLCTLNSNLFFFAAAACASLLSLYSRSTMSAKDSESSASEPSALDDSVLPLPLPLLPLPKIWSSETFCRPFKYSKSAFIFAIRTLFLSLDRKGMLNFLHICFNSATFLLDSFSSRDIKPGISPLPSAPSSADGISDALRMRSMRTDFFPEHFSPRFLHRSFRSTALSVFRRCSNSDPLINALPAWTPCACSCCCACCAFTLSM